MSTCQIKRSGDSLTVLVIDRESESCYARRKLPVLPAVARCHGLPHAAKTMALEKGEDGYGFMLKHEKLAGTRGYCEYPTTTTRTTLASVAGPVCDIWRTATSSGHTLDCSVSRFLSLS